MFGGFTMAKCDDSDDNQSGSSELQEEPTSHVEEAKVQNTAS